MGFMGFLQDTILSAHDKQLRTNDMYQLSMELHPETYDAMERMRTRRKEERLNESYARHTSATASNQSSTGGALLALGALALVGYGAKKMWDHFSSKDSNNNQIDSIPSLQEGSLSKE